jgi:hypothetical protein
MSDRPSNILPDSLLATVAAAKKEARAEALEEAAKLCDEHAKHDPNLWPSSANRVAASLALKIRKLDCNKTAT